MADRFALPGEDAEEMQLDVRVRIDEALDQPRRGAAHREAEFLVQFAVQRGARRLARLELAAGKLPVAGVDLAGRALRQQDLAVGADDDGGGDPRERRRHARVFSAAAPA